MEKVSAMLVCSIFLKSVFCLNIGMMMVLTMIFLSLLGVCESACTCDIFAT